MSIAGSGLTKLLQELVAAIQQMRDAHTQVQELSEEIRDDGIPELEAAAPGQNLAELYRGYEVQAQIQQLKALNQDTTELINEMVGLLLFIRAKLVAAHGAQTTENAQVAANYKTQMNQIRLRHSQISQDKHDLVLAIRKRQDLLVKMSRALAAQERAAQEQKSA